MRNINDILYFRQDVAPFLAHLTRRTANRPARQVLEQIIAERQLRSGVSLVSDARFGGFTKEMAENERRRFFSAVCFTETPLAEIHCLLDIASRAVNLEPYGLVFLKERLKEKAVMPVLYFNNHSGAIDSIIQAMFGLKNDSPDEASILLPLVAVFGQKIKPPGVHERPAGLVDFCWEREWRYPSSGPFDFEMDDIFCGLCPHPEIAHFEHLLPNVRFIDPTRNMKWYATALIEARQRVDLKTSVV